MTSRRRRRGRARVVLGGWWAWAASRVDVQVDGKPLSLRRGTTVGALLAGRPRDTLWGDLLAVDGSVLRPGMGDPPVLKADGVTVTPSATLVDGQRVTVSRGRDITEPSQRAVSETPPPVRTLGTGPLIVLERPGIPRRVVTVTGKLSKITVRDRVESTLISAVMRRKDARPKERVVALTFDDGPNPAYTPKIMDILKDRGVKATFFLLGSAAARYPELARRAHSEGHQVASHSYYHLNWDRVAAKAIDEDIRWSLDAIERATGVRPTWLRPPGGRTNQTVFALLQRSRLSGVMWTADTHDWRRPPVADIVYRALSGARPGAIVLMHDGGGDRSNTVAALPAILDGLKRRSFRAVTIEELARLAEGQPSEEQSSEGRP